MSKDLLNQKCVPCEGGVDPLLPEEVRNYMADVEGWELSLDSKMISKTFKFADFIGAINFVERVADVAEMDNHHPDIHINYNKVRLELTTHAIGGLSQNDFIVAAKINAVK